MDLVTAADELYALPPGQFTSARDGKAAEAKGSGDLELSRSIKQLRRPTISAWLANLLMRERGRKISQLIDLGAAMRQAQSDLAADDMRALSEQRRQLVAALATEARGLARELRQPVNHSSIQELEETLEAAIADSAAAESLRSGRLTTALHYSGFGPVDLTGAVAAPTGKKSPKSASRKQSPSSTGAPAVTRAKERRSDAEQALREAEAASQQAQRLVHIEEKRLSRAKAEKDRLSKQSSTLEKQIRALRESVKRAESTHDDAERALDDAKRSVKSANSRVVRARSALDRI